MAGDRHIPASLGSAPGPVAYDPAVLSPETVTRVVGAATALLAAVDGQAEISPFAPSAVQLALPAALLRAELVAIGALAPEGASQ